MVASIGKITSPSQGASYYERDGYYAKDDPAHREASRWAGKGAEALGLSGPVDPDTFRQILEGKVPDGPQLGRRGRDGEIQHRPGRDVTLSAPKSVSLLALVGGDGRIVEAHDQAVGKTLAWIEEHAVRTRMQDKATRAMIRVGGQKMVAATFRHDTSRNLDPQLHTHCVIANMVQGGDGKWRTMVDDGLFKGKMAIGSIYRAELAEGLKDLGYRLEKTHPDGRFEIAGVPRDVIEAFSTRRAEIEAAMAERGLGTPAENPHLAARATLMTRASKRDMDKVALRETWNLQAAALGFSADAIRDHARQAERERPPPDLFTHPGDSAGKAARWAVTHLSERQAVFGHNDLLAATLGRDPGAVSAKAAERAIAALEHQGGLHAARGLNDDRHWTTDAALSRESETIALDAGWPGRGEGHHAGLGRRDEAPPGPPQRGPEGRGQDDPHHERPGDRRPGLCRHREDHDAEAAPGARGKPRPPRRGPRTLGLGRQHAGPGIRDPVGDPAALSRPPCRSHRGSRHGEGSAQPPESVRQDRPGRGRELARLQRADARVAPRRDLLRLARVVLVGDEKQLGAVEAGKPFAQLRAAGMQTVVMDEIFRQRDTELKEAVRASLAGEVKTAFAKLDGHITQVDKDELGQTAAGHWLRLSPDQRTTTGVTAPTRALRDTINGTIRADLVAEGAITGPAYEGEKLVSRGLTRAQMTVAGNYARGDTVIFNRTYKTLGVEPGDERRVVGVDQRWKKVHLADEQGRIVKWAPERLAAAKGGVEVYRAKAMELRAGDRVRWTRNDPGSGLVNGAIATVERIERDGVRFRLEDGSVARLADGDPQMRHLDHAWAATVHAFQGRTVDRIIAAMPAEHPKLTTQQAFYVAISRARDRAELVTDDAWKLADQLQKATGERVAALDGVALQAAHEKVFGVEGAHERERGHAADTPRTTDRSIETGRGHQTGPETDRKRGGKSRARDAVHRRAGRETDENGHGLGRGRHRSHGSERDSAAEKSMEPAPKSVELDLGM